MAEDAGHPSIEDKALRDTLDDPVEVPRDPKLTQQDLMDTAEISKVPREGETQESILSHKDFAGTQLLQTKE